jgi:hypothetical protein
MNAAQALRRIGGCDGRRQDVGVGTFGDRSRLSGWELGLAARLWDWLAEAQQADDGCDDPYAPSGAQEPQGDGERADNGMG